MPGIGQIIRAYGRNYPALNSAIALFALALITVIWAATTQRIAFERHETIANAERENSTLAMAFEAQIVRTLRAAQQVALLVRHEYAMVGSRTNLPDLIRRGVINETVFTIISVVNEHGDIAHSSMRTGRVNYADRDFFRFHRRSPNKELFVSKPVFGRVSSTWQVPMAIRIDKPDGSFGGVVVLSVDPADFTDFYQSADLGRQGVVTLAGIDGITRARKVGARSTYGEDMAGSALFAQQLAQPSGIHIGPGPFDGVRRIHSYRTLKEYPLIVTVGTEETDVLAEAHQRARHYYLAAILSTLLTMAFCAGLIAALARQRQAKERLAHQAHHDSLTNLPNRMLCYDRLQQALIQARRRKTGVGFLFIDLDGFKTINDTLGHAFGDELLRQVAARLARCVRAEDTVARLGGDEFAIVLSEVAKASDCELVARKVVDGLATSPFQLDKREVRVCASVGVAAYPDHGADPDTLVKRADTAMFRAKKDGKNSYQVYASALT